MPKHNAYQVADWNGPNGARWVANQARLDHMLAVFGDAAIEAAAPANGERVLDVGCGAGTSSLALAVQVGKQGSVLGLDISEALIARARECASADAPIPYRLADASSAPLTDQAFDLLFSRFGVMFFDDPIAAFTHMRGALKVGGRVVFVCWRAVDENDWVRLPMGAIKGIVPPSSPPDPEAAGPFSFEDRDRITRILNAAGFTDIALAPSNHAIPFGQGETREAAVEDALDMAFQVGPLSRELADQPDDIRAHAAEAVRAAFAQGTGEQSVMIDGAAWIVTARNRA